jgi:CDP-glucose 4,6-dehydratase
LFNEIFKNKRVIVTGHTGFKGSWLSAWLKLCGANVTGIALSPPSKPSHFESLKLNNSITDLRLDIRDTEKVTSTLKKVAPHFVFHLAAQPIVKESYVDPKNTYDTNVIGTLNVLEALRSLGNPCVAVFITSDKAYRNYEWDWGYRENDELGGTDPYSASKAAAEILIRSHVNSFFNDENTMIRIGIGRAGNVIGGGDWAEARIIPDCIRSWSNNQTAIIRKPNSTRPWQHVLEPLSGYLFLAKSLLLDKSLHGEPFNFGPSQTDNHSVMTVANTLKNHLFNFSWKEYSKNSETIKEAGLLKLNCDKALSRLDWRAILSFDETIQFTADWYRNYYAKPEEIDKVTNQQIRRYMKLLKSRLLK